MSTRSPFGSTAIWLAMVAMFWLDICAGVDHVAPPSVVRENNRIPAVGMAAEERAERPLVARERPSVPDRVDVARPRRVAGDRFLVVEVETRRVLDERLRRAPGRAVIG